MRDPESIEIQRSLWTPCSQVLAPHMKDFYATAELAHILYSPTGTPKLFSIFVCVNYLLPCACCVLLRATIRWYRFRSRAASPLGTTRTEKQIQMKQKTQ